MQMLRNLVIRPKSWGLLGGMVLLGLGLLELLSCTSSRNQTYWNLAPDALYVGMDACQSCHAELYASYQQTGMGRSWYRPNAQPRIEDFGPTAEVVDTATGYHYRPFWRNDSLFILEFRMHGLDTTYRRLEHVNYIVGSGHQTRSYVLARDSFLYEAPITWYVSRQGWDLSPGYHLGNNSRFNRPIGAACMACHNGHSPHDSSTVNRYRQVALGIGCEQCHGPGKPHVERMRAGEEVDVGREIDYSIVNPAKLSVQEQFDVCQQCHLQGLTIPLKKTPFRPGRALADVQAIFLPQPEDPNQFGIASHAERLRRSDCFQQTAGQLVCTTCHDPHQSVQSLSVKSLGDTYFNRVCQDCHGGTGLPEQQLAATNVMCTERAAIRQAADNNCQRCHMPKGGTSDIPHVRFSDHFIRVVRDSVPVQGADPLAVANQRMALEFFCATHDAPPPGTEAQAQLLYFAEHGGGDAYLRAAARQADQLPALQRAKLQFYLKQFASARISIEQALAQHADAWTRYWQAQILEANQELPAAEAAYAAAFQEAPYLVEAGLQQARLHLVNHPNASAALATAAALYLTVLERNSQQVVAWTNLGAIRLKQGRYQDALAALEQALHLDPLRAAARANAVEAALRTRNLSRAQHHLTALMRNHPSHPRLGTLRAMLRNAAA